jgi:hypothetical protein
MRPQKVVVDRKFIAKWHPKYDGTEGDEKECQSIIKAASSDICKAGTLLKETFRRIIEWKEGNRRGLIGRHIQWKAFSEYGETIRQCLHVPDDEKIKKLNVLRGLGMSYPHPVPVASTVLFFLYPEGFPIMDIKTVQSLHYNGYIDSLKKDQKRYLPFRVAILKISQHTGQSLRTIDRALFAYHKNELQPHLKSREICE